MVGAGRPEWALQSAATVGSGRWNRAGRVGVSWWVSRTAGTWGAAGASSAEPGSRSVDSSPTRLRYIGSNASSRNSHSHGRRRRRRRAAAAAHGHRSCVLLPAGCPGPRTFGSEERAAALTREHLLAPIVAKRIVQTQTSGGSPDQGDSIADRGRTWRPRAHTACMCNAAGSVCDVVRSGRRRR